MNLGAALAGGAQGVMGGWDDNREAIKAQAERDFKMTLEETRMTNTRALRDEGWKREDAKEERYLQDEEVRLGNERAAAMEQRAHEISENDKDRESREKASALRAGNSDKLPSKIKLAAEQLDILLKKDMLTPQDEENIKYYRGIVDGHIGGREPDAPNPGAIAKLTSGKGTQRELEGFERAFGLEPGTAKKLYDKANPAPQKTVEVADTSAAGLLAGRNKVVANKAKKAKTDREKGKATSDAADYIEKVKNGSISSTQSFLKGGVSSAIKSSANGQLQELANIADNPNIDAEVRREARAMIQKFILLEQGKKAETR